MHVSNYTTESLSNRLQRMLQVIEFGGQVDNTKLDLLLNQIQQFNSARIHEGNENADNL